MKNQKGGSILLILRINLSDVVMTHKRQVYSILDVFGDYGGVEYVLLTISAFIVAPFAEYQFNIKAISKLFLVKTNDPTIMPERTNKKAKKKLE